VRQCVIEGQAWKSEGMETNCFNAVLGVWLDVRILKGVAFHIGFAGRSKSQACCLHSGGLAPRFLSR
jgi:hypothetical protein